MWIALGLTATDGGPPLTQACAAAAPLVAHVFPPSPDAQGVFAGLIASARPRHSAGSALAVSSAVHVAAAAALILVPLFSPAPPPASPDYIRVLIYDPPPPPPPPLPKGSPRVPGRPRPAARATAPAPEGERPAPTLPAAMQPVAAMPQADPPPPATDTEPSGSPGGADSGVPEGMEGGVAGGVAGGVPGGVLGGVIGGTGQGIVSDYDRPPRLLRQTKPRYPQDAFVKRIEGTVLVEFVIDPAGRVVAARVLQSVPPLDAAALEAVRDWVFAPALKHGVPVASRARAPVVFRIY